MRARLVVLFVRSGSVQVPYVWAFGGSGVGVQVVPDLGDGRLGLFQLLGVVDERFALVIVAADLYDCVGNLLHRLVQKLKVRLGVWSVFGGVVVFFVVGVQRAPQRLLEGAIVDWFLEVHPVGVGIVTVAVDPEY